MKKIVLTSLFVASLFFSCKKEEPKKSDEKLFTYNSLTCDDYDIPQGDVTNIRASVTGEVTYAWSCSSGDIFGGGSVVLFGAGTCCSGDHTVTCTVSDANGNSEAKSVVLKIQ